MVGACMLVRLHFQKAIIHAKERSVVGGDGRRAGGSLGLVLLHGAAFPALYLHR